jgi:hypothetical protein
MPEILGLAEMLGRSGVKFSILEYLNGGEVIDAVSEKPDTTVGLIPISVTPRRMHEVSLHPIPGVYDDLAHVVNARSLLPVVDPITIDIDNEQSYKVGIYQQTDQ